MNDVAVLAAPGFDPAPLRRFFPALRTVPADTPLEALKGCTPVFALRNGDLQAATARFRGADFPEAYVYPTDGAVKNQAPIPADLKKPRLDYMETELSETCNLNCRGCCDFSNLLGGRRFYDFDRFSADLNRLKELFWGVATIRLMGGEPLLNPRLPEYVETARRIFPDTDLRIVSNGLLVPALSEETLRRIAAAGCSFDISAYPPTRKKKREISAVLQGAGVSFRFGVPMYFFFRNLRAEPAESPVPAFRNCIFTHCHMLGNGRLAPCSFAYCAYRFNERFDADYPETDFTDLYEWKKDGWALLERLSSPHEFCRWCGTGIAPIPWKGHCGRDAAKPSDWVIPPTFFNLRVLPLVQRAAKPAAVRLRAAIRKRDEK